MKPEITSKNIISVLSNQWLKVDEINDIMGIEDPLDNKYLIMRLNDLYRKGEIEYTYFHQDIYWKVNKFSEPGEYGLELDFYSELVDNDPNDIEAWSKLGILYDDDMYYIEAIPCFEAVIDMDPFDARIWMLLGQNYRELPEEELSIKCYENALRLVDYDLEINIFITTSLNLSDLYNREADYNYEENYYNRSLKVLEHLLEFKLELKDSELIIAYNLIALNYVDKNEFIKAIEPIEKALEIDSESKITKETMEYLEELTVKYIKENGVSPFYNIRLKIEDDIEITETILEIINKIERSSIGKSENSDYIILNQNSDSIIHNQDTIKKEIYKEILKEFKEFRKSFEKSSEKRDTILLKSYIDGFIQFFFEKPSKKQLEKLKTSLEGVLRGFPDYMRDLVSDEYSRTLEQYKFLMPKKWKKWGLALIKLIPLIVT